MERSKRRNKARKNSSSVLRMYRCPEKQNSKKNVKKNALNVKKKCVIINCLFVFRCQQEHLYPESTLMRYVCNIIYIK